MNQRSKDIFSVLLVVILSGCSIVAEKTPAPTSTPASTATPQPPEITFEVTFDEDENCIITGPSQIPTGEYLFQLTTKTAVKWILLSHT